MYRVLESELALNGINKKQLCNLLNSISYNTLLQKFKGDFAFTFDEVLQIKKAIGSRTPVEILFSQEMPTNERN